MSLVGGGQGGLFLGYRSRSGQSRAPPPAVPSPPVPSDPPSGLLASLSPPRSSPALSPHPSCPISPPKRPCLQTACFALGPSPDICFHFPSVGARGAVGGPGGDESPASPPGFSWTRTLGEFCAHFGVSFLLRPQALTWPRGARERRAGHSPQRLRRPASPCLPPAWRAHSRAHTNTRTHSRVNTHVLTHEQARPQAHAPSCTLTRAHQHIHNHMHTHRHVLTYSHRHMPTCLYTHAHICSWACCDVLTHNHTHMHSEDPDTHAHTHRGLPLSSPVRSHTCAHPCVQGEAPLPLGHRPLSQVGHLCSPPPRKDTRAPSHTCTHPSCLHGRCSASSTTSPPPPLLRSLLLCSFLGLSVSLTHAALTYTHTHTHVAPQHFHGVTGCVCEPSKPA